VVSAGGIEPLLELIKSKFEILQAEGLRSLQALIQHGFKDQLAAAGTKVVIANFKAPPSVQPVCDQIMAAL
jgi:hypothetical protein